MKLTTRAPIQAFALMLTCVAIAAGCSSSGSGEPTLPPGTESDTTGLDDPVVPDPIVPDPIVPDPVVPDPVVSDPIAPDPGPTLDPASIDEAEDANEEPAAVDAGVLTPDEPPASQQADSQVESPAPVADDADPTPADATAAVPDPLVQNTTVVSFEVTVPAYQSDALQVRLSWGDVNTSLAWQGDEYWSIDVELPADTERPLSIVFFDENGGIELGSYERSFMTGTNAAEIHSVAANQFDTDRWDVDADGVSNLNELIAGTDPRVDEDSLLPVVDVQDMSLLFIANYFESLLPDERPYEGTVLDDDGVTTVADIDANGNGSLAVTEPPTREKYRIDRSGERLVTEDSVRWSGSWSYTDYDYNFRQHFTSEVSVDGESSRLVEEGSGSWVGFYSHRWETTVDVMGQPIEGSELCDVASGTITERYTYYDGAKHNTTTLTLVKASASDLWRVSRVYESGDERSTSAYFARELRMHMIRFNYRFPESENDHFNCVLDDL